MRKDKELSRNMEEIKKPIEEKKVEKLKVGNLRVEIRYATGDKTLQERMLAILKQKGVQEKK